MELKEFKKEFEMKKVLLLICFFLAVSLPHANAGAGKELVIDSLTIRHQSSAPSGINGSTSVAFFDSDDKLKIITASSTKEVLTVESTGASGTVLASNGMGGYGFAPSLLFSSSSICTVADQKPAGTAGGSCVGQNYSANSRVINAKLSGECTFVDVSTGNMLFIDGQYYLRCHTPCYTCDYNKTVLTHASGTIPIIGYGSSTVSWNPNTSTIYSVIQTHLTVSGGTSSVGIGQWVNSVAGAGNCKGRAGTDGSEEVYTYCEIIKF